MELDLGLGGLRFHFCSERALGINAELKPFRLTSPGRPDLVVRVTWAWAAARQPVQPPVGQDALLNYYEEGEWRWCLTRGGPKGFVASTVYHPDLSDMVCTINEAPFLMPPQMLGSVLRMLPLREIFLRHGVLFFHASQIVYQGRGILFAAPSGTGKSTQARLWRRCRGAEIVCNDRTLTRKEGDRWLTYGYPLDGSEPVRSTEVSQLGCLVLLRQGTENAIWQPRPGKALSLLMRQVVLDSWSGEERTVASELLLTFLRDIPVFQLTCTPDEGAVECLEHALTERKVISCE